MTMKHNNNNIVKPKEGDAPLWLRLLPYVLQILPLVAYILPLYRSASTNRDHPVMDEQHLLTPGHNKDIFPDDLPWWDVFYNDYWGRPIDAFNSNKSWRPLTVLSFRFTRNWKLFNSSVFHHRLISVLIHSVLCHFVGYYGSQLFTSNSRYLTQSIIQLLFSLHPTHVEAVANAANRPHILSLLLMILAVEYKHLAEIQFLLVASALLTGETALFAVPAIILTMTVLKWKRDTTQYNKLSLQKTIKSLTWRYVGIVAVAMIYFIGRHMTDTLNIDSRLIRKAENCFYLFSGMKRLVNYSFVGAAHVGKAILIDPVGTAHEYGFDCVPEISGFRDARLMYPIFVLISFAVAGVYCFYKSLEYFVMYFLFGSWIATLFPLFGIIKIGTFISDRMVVASTVSVCMFAGAWISNFLVPSNMSTSSTSKSSKTQSNTLTSTLIALSSVVFASFLLFARISRRTNDWTDFRGLIKKGLQTCPRSSKFNLEWAELNWPMQENVAIEHFRKAEEIDPDFCDVHWTWVSWYYPRIIKGNVALQLELENRLTKAVICPYTMNNAYQFYTKYWTILLTDSSSDAYQPAQQRYQIQHAALELAQQKEIKAEDKVKKTQSLFGGFRDGDDSL